MFNEIFELKLINIFKRFLQKLDKSDIIIKIFENQQAN